MEEIQQKKSTDTTKKIEFNQSYKTVRDGGELVFRRVESKDGALNSVISDPISVFQRKDNTNFIMVDGLFEHQIYKIEDQTIKFVSSHKVDLPLKCLAFKVVITENRILYFFEKRTIEKREQHLKFFKQHNIDWTTPSYVVFEFEYGIGKPRIIKAEYVGEMKKDFGGFAEWDLKEIFDSQNALFNKGLSLLKAKLSPDRSSWVSYMDYVFLGQFGVRQPNLFKRFFQFNLTPLNLYGYYAKLDQDKHNMKNITLNNLSLKSIYNGFCLENWEPGKTKRFKPFIKFDPKMMIIGLIDLRKRRIPVKSLISIYEILGSLRTNRKINPNVFKVFKIDYSVEMDLLVMDAWLKFEYDTNRKVRGPSLSGNGAGKEKWSLATLRDLKITTFPVRETTKVRFKIWGVFDMGRRGIEGENLGYRENSSFHHSNEIFTTLEEDEEDIKVEVVSKAEETLINFGENVNPNLQPLNQGSFSEVKKSILEVNKKVLSKAQGINAYGVKNAFMVDESHLLIACATKMLLYDAKTCQLLSSCDYSNNVSVASRTLMDQDVMIATQNKQDFIEVFKVSVIDDSPQFVPLGLLNPKTLDLQFYCFKKLIAFKKVKEQTYELKARAYWRKSQKFLFSSEVIYSVRFELKKQEKGQRMPIPKIIQGSVDYIFSTGRNDPGMSCKAYFNSSKWNHILNNGRGKSFFQTSFGEKSKLVSEAVENLALQSFPIRNFLIYGNRAYLDLKYGDKRRLSIVQFNGKGIGGGKGRGIKPIERVFMRIDPNKKVYFSEVTEDLRIFIFGKAKDSPGMGLKVLDERFKVLQKIGLPQISTVEQVKVINHKCLVLLCKLLEEGDRNVSLILNLAELTFKRLVVEGEGPLFAVPHDLGDGNLLVFPKDQIGVDLPTPDRIFAAQMNF